MASSFSIFSKLSQLFESISTNTGQTNDNEESLDDIDSHHMLSISSKCDDIFSTNFNQDNTCIAVATVSGFRIFQCKPFTKAFECNDNAISCRKVSMLFATSLVALIGNTSISTLASAPDSTSTPHTSTLPDAQQSSAPLTTTATALPSSLRNVKLYNTKNKQELCRLNFKSTVLDVKMNKSRLAVCVEHKIHIFDLINNMKQIHEVITYANGTGIFDLCCDEDNCLLGYPDKSKCGSIGILDAYNLQKRTIIDAHDSSLQMIQFNADGNYLCSASQMGTLMRIFAIPSGTHLYTFRRGTYPSSIYSMAFNPSSTLLAITSSSASVHIFDLNKYKYNESKKISSSQSINRINSKLNEFLPHSIKNQIEHPRSIITINIKHPHSPSPIKCGWLNDYSLLCCTKNGYFYRYHINDTLKTYKLLSEHTLRDTEYDLDKQQKTKIYKNNQNEKKQDKEEPKEEEKEMKTDDTNHSQTEEQLEHQADEENYTEHTQMEEHPNEEDKRNIQSKDKLAIDDLFDLSDNEFETPGGGNLP